MDNKSYRESLTVINPNLEETRRKNKEAREEAEKLYPQAIELALYKLESYFELYIEETHYLTVPELKDELKVTSPVACEIHQMLKNKYLIDVDGKIFSIESLKDERQKLKGINQKEEKENNLNEEYPNLEKKEEKNAESRKKVEKLYLQAMNLVLHKLDEGFKYHNRYKKELNYLTVAELKYRLQVTSPVACEIYQMLQNNHIIDTAGKFCVSSAEAYYIINQAIGNNQGQEVR